MEFTKSSLKKALEVVIVDGNRYPVEVLEATFKAEIGPRDTIESMRAALHDWVDRKFNDLMAAEMGLMPQRLKEAKQLELSGFFNDQPGAVSAAVRDFIKASAQFDGDVEISSGGRTVKVPKP